MDRRGFLKVLGIGAAGLVGARSLFGADKRNLKFRKVEPEAPSLEAEPFCAECGEPLHNWPHAMHDEYMICDKCKSMYPKSEPVLFVGGPLHGQVEDWRCQTKEFPCFDLTGHLTHTYRRYGTVPGKCFAIVDGLSSSKANILCYNTWSESLEDDEYNGWLDYWNIRPSRDRILIVRIDDYPCLKPHENSSKRVR